MLTELQAAKLKQAIRDALPASDFAVPSKRMLPINDPDHVIKAWQLKDTAEGLSDDELTEAKKRILARAKVFGIDTSGWAGMKATATLDHALIGTSFVANAIQLEAANLEKEHINKLVGTGVLTKLDEPSDAPLGGSNGRRVILPAAVAKAALHTLIGMPLNFSENFDAHEKKRPVGNITAAKIVGNEIHIEFYLYAINFPEETKKIQSEKSMMGFSYEIADVIYTENKADKTLEVLSCTFTGAAILYKDKAAYKTTSLNANNEDSQMSQEIKELMAANKALTEKVESLEAAVKNTTDGTKPLYDKEARRMKRTKRMMTASAKLRSAARLMEAAGVGGDPRRGHVAVARDMADQMELATRLGTMPHIYLTHEWLGLKASAEDQSDNAKTAEDSELKKEIERQKAEIENLKTQMNDSKKSSFAASASPERKTLPPEITALLTMNASGEAAKKVSVAQVDEALVKAKIPEAQAITIKRNMRADGLI